MDPPDTAYQPRPQTVGIVANEPSGDLLGAGLMEAILQRRPDVRFEGVGGPRMERLGLHSLYRMDELAVMGLVEVLRHLPRILRIRRGLREHFLRTRPEVVVGIDAPDFNLALEQALRADGIRTVHYVSPTVWAWRHRRVIQLRRSVDLLLGIFPFEKDVLNRAGVPFRYVGHPLADEIEGAGDRDESRERLGLNREAPVLAVLPGSRRGEVERLSQPFLSAARLCAKRIEDLQIVVPMFSPELARVVRRELDQWPIDAKGSVLVVDGQSRTAIAAADIVLAASGTVTLEAMLLERPMVVGYRLSPLTYFLLKALRLVKVERVSLPNLLLEEAVVDEFLQGACTAENLAAALLALFGDTRRQTEMLRRFRSMRAVLRKGASERAADAVLAIADGCG